MGGTARLWRFAEKNKLLWTIQNATPRSWWHTVIWCCYSLLGGLFPSLASLFLTGLHSRPFVFMDFIGHGEFALYATAFLAVVLHQVVRNIRDSNPVLGLGTVFVAVFGLLVSAVLYAGVQDGHQVSYPFLRATSISLLLVSFLLAAMVTLVEMEIRELDLNDSEKESVKSLEKRFGAKGPVSTVSVSEISSVNQDSPVPDESDLERMFVSPASDKRLLGGADDVK